MCVFFFFFFFLYYFTGHAIFPNREQPSLYPIRKICVYVVQLSQNTPHLRVQASRLSLGAGRWFLGLEVWDSELGPPTSSTQFWGTTYKDQPQGCGRVLAGVWLART